MATQRELILPENWSAQSIEEFKRAIEVQTQELAQNIRGPTSLLARNGTATTDLDNLCSTCGKVGDRIQEVVKSSSNSPSPGNIVSRGSSDNIFIGTIPEIFAQRSCNLCSLLGSAFLREKRRDIYRKMRSSDVHVKGLRVEYIIGVLSQNDDLEDWAIQDANLMKVELSLNALVVEGMLSFWWPESLADEVNDEPSVLLMLAEEHEALRKQKKPYIPLPRTATDDCRDLNIFLGCLKVCSEQHSGCSLTATTSRPRRLLDLHEMKIVKIKEQDTHPYLALSYVWGKAPFLILRTSNEKELSNEGGLHQTILPNTILDAMEVTRRFEYRYLWVDALCIMQDDFADKMHEIQRMHEIYSQADMTIVAATGDEANCGILKRDVAFQHEIVSCIGGIQFTHDHRQMREAIEFSTWFTRGWTFQELVFSRRILYFTPERTYFSCASGNWSEDFPLIEKNPHEDVYFDDDPKHGFDFQKLATFDNYSSMVEKISLRNFTQEVDILDACRGFYSGFLEQTLGASVCGLPASCFEYSLAWQPDGRLRRRGEGPHRMPIPSWSWAGWIGPIAHSFISPPQELEVQTSIAWNIWTLEPFDNWMSNDSSGVFKLGQVIPTLPENLYSGNCRHTRWPFPSTQASRDSSCWIREHQIQFGRHDLRMKYDGDGRSFVGHSLLVFKTETVTCSIVESDTPSFAMRKDLCFMAIKNGVDILGELKLDPGTMQEMLNSDSIGDIGKIELVSLFRMNFGAQSMNNMLWLSSQSKHGYFGTQFVDMISRRDDKEVCVVMWIKWRDGIAYRVAVGYVTVEGFESCSPIEKEIVLG